MDMMSRMDIIDCHEHLPPEKERTDSPQDVFTLFSQYVKYDLFSAGMDASAWQGQVPYAGARPLYESLFDYDIPLAKRWQRFKPYWQVVRHGSYASAALLTAKMVYGFDDINDTTYKPLSEAISAENTPGIYKRMLCDRCNIKVVLNQNGFREPVRPLATVIEGYIFSEIQTRQRLEEVLAEAGIERAGDLDEYLQSIGTVLKTWADKGAVGIKFNSRPNAQPDRKAAEQAFNNLLDGRELTMDATGFEPLTNFLNHTIIDMAAELDFVICIHAGIWCDFRQLDSKHMLTMAPAHPQAVFSLYHLGMPSVRDTIVIAKNLPNVFLNLCWIHVISQTQTCSGIDELLDQVPINKILAFGGDYNRPVEKVVGHLHMAREDFASVFSHRIDRGQMSINQAEEILKLWFWQNPLDLHKGLKV